MDRGEAYYFIAGAVCAMIGSVLGLIIVNLLF